jgi:uncharacterized protein (TIGR01244 family)
MADIRVLTDSFSAAPQIAVADVAGLAVDGYTLVICNRPDGEDGGQPPAAALQAAAADAGLGFVWIPVSGGPGRDQIDAMASALASAGEGRVLAYCRSGTRSATLWALARATQGDDAAGLIAAAARGGYELSMHRATLAALAGG